MKKTVLRYGLLSSLVIVILFLLSFMIFHDTNFAAQEVFGWASMVISLLFVFFGIKHYRDKENGGILSFGQGMKIGVLIVLIPALVFGVFDILYVTVINPGFMETYYQHSLTQLQQSLPAADFEKEKVKLQAQMDMFSNPVVNGLVMALTVFMIGLIVTVISSLILRRSGRPAMA
jgi:hypothetical protein